MDFCRASPYFCSSPVVASRPCPCSRRSSGGRTAAPRPARAGRCEASRVVLETSMPPEPIADAAPVPTGVPGLDGILMGGYSAHRAHLIEGRPGSGKTTLGLQFLLDGMARGERCLYITLSESKRELLSVAERHGWSLDGL